MADPNDPSPKTQGGGLDLSSLSAFSLGPDWLNDKKPRAPLPRELREDRPARPAGPQRDRRGPPPPRRAAGPERTDRPERADRPQRSERFDRQDRPQRHGRPEHAGPREPEIFRPVVVVDFYPDEDAFRVMSHAIRTSCRTFELFEIARLILEKPDRFVCLVKDPEHREGEPARLHASVPDGLPFRSEDEALEHAFRHYMGEFFEVETVEVDPPAGTFVVINKCGITGDLLGPPNYHRYQALCRAHHAAKLANVPYARFEQRIEGSREPADIQAWLDKMKLQTRYKLKEEPHLTMDNPEDARLYLLTHAREKLVRPAFSARFSGKAIALLNPSDPIRRSVEFLLDHQRKFPLETANHLRGRLRRMNFAVYKRGSKGISFVCAVKRRFRKPDEILADNLRELMEFIEAHPNFPARELPKAFLGIDVDKRRPAPAPAPAPAAEPAAEAAPEPAAEAAPEPAPEPAAEATPEPAPEAAAEPPRIEPPAKPHLSPDELLQIRRLMTDLRYLVTEGYMIEYSDGRLFVPPVREEEIRHHEKEEAREAHEAKAEAAAEIPAAPEPVAAEPAPAEDPPSTEAQPGAEAQPSAAEEPVAAEPAPAVEEPVAAKEPIVVEEPVAAKEPIVVEEAVTAEEPPVVEEPVTAEEPPVVEEPVTAEEPPVAEEAPVPDPKPSGG